VIARLAHALAALAAFTRGFVGIPAHAHDRRSARESLAEAAARRGRCC
jgi:hypothetical protein